MAEVGIDLLQFEREYYSTHRVVGIDEAGRGCLAGGVYAGAVMLRADRAELLAEGALKGVTDSKQLSAHRREQFFEVIRELSMAEHPPLWYGVGVASVEEIDRLNILNATHLAMRRAVEKLSEQPTFALVDGLAVKGLPIEHLAIVKGDAKSLSIAAASIVAKVSRDRALTELEARYPGYGFANHKGYGTPEHLNLLRQLGVTPEHRRSFAPVREVLLGDGLFEGVDGEV